MFVVSNKWPNNERIKQCVPPCIAFCQNSHSELWFWTFAKKNPPSKLSFVIHPYKRTFPFIIKLADADIVRIDISRIILSFFFNPIYIQFNLNLLLKFILQFQKANLKIYNFRITKISKKKKKISYEKYEIYIYEIVFRK